MHKNRIDQQAPSDWLHRNKAELKLILAWVKRHEDAVAIYRSIDGRYSPTVVREVCWWRKTNVVTIAAAALIFACRDNEVSAANVASHS